VGTQSAKTVVIFLYCILPSEIPDILILGGSGSIGFRPYSSRVWLQIEVI
jgi:hypothetical protein